MRELPIRVNDVRSVLLEDNVAWADGELRRRAYKLIQVVLGGRSHAVAQEISGLETCIRFRLEVDLE